MQRNSWRIVLGQKKANGPRKHLRGCSRGAAPSRVRQEAQARPGGVVPTSSAPQTAYLLYK